MTAQQQGAIGDEGRGAGHGGQRAAIDVRNRGDCSLVYRDDRFRVLELVLFQRTVVS